MTNTFEEKLDIETNHQEGKDESTEEPSPEDIGKRRIYLEGEIERLEEMEPGKRPSYPRSLEDLRQELKKLEEMSKDTENEGGE